MRSRFELVCYLAGLPEEADLFAEAKAQVLGAAEARSIADEATALRRLIVGHIAAPRAITITSSLEKDNDP